MSVTERPPQGKARKEGAGKSRFSRGASIFSAVCDSRDYLNNNPTYTFISQSQSDGSPPPPRPSRPSRHDRQHLRLERPCGPTAHVVNGTISAPIGFKRWITVGPACPRTSTLSRGRLRRPCGAGRASRGTDEPQSPCPSPSRTLRVLPATCHHGPRAPWAQDSENRSGAVALDDGIGQGGNRAIAGRESGHDAKLVGLRTSSCSREMDVNSILDHQVLDEIARVWERERLLQSAQVDPNSLANGASGRGGGFAGVRAACVSLP